MQETRSRDRVIALVLYSIALFAVQWWLIDRQIPPSTTLGLWFYNGFASLLLGTRLLNPYYTPPADAATNSFVSLVTVIAAYEAIGGRHPDDKILICVGIVCGAILIAAIAVLIFRRPLGTVSPLWVTGLDKFVRGLGSPNVIFTIVILAAVWIFHRTQPIQVYSILAAWTVIITFSPVESIFDYVARLRLLHQAAKPGALVGLVTAYQSPGIVLIRQSDATAFSRGTTFLVTDEHGPKQLAVALNYVGRDEGNLLRAVTVPIPDELTDAANDLAAVVGQGVAAQFSFDAGIADKIPDGHPASIVRRMEQFCGIVDQDTSLEHLQFEVIDDKGLSEGKLVEASIDAQAVLYQVIEGVTREEIVQQKNKYGYVRAGARKIGVWDPEESAFKPMKWLPRINSPVFLKESAVFQPDALSVGHFPGTSYGARVNITDAVTHNTAVLGILGIGKSYLGIELVERMIAEGVKVICLDLTNQYATQLAAFIDFAKATTDFAELDQVGGRGEAHQNKEEGGTRSSFQEKVVEQFKEFLDPNNEEYLRVYNPTQFEVWEQTGGFFKGQAAMASLTACEITAVIAEAILEVVQLLEVTDKARICLVLEEAHSLVPEWNSIAAEGDKTATAVTARAILQGRKYGFGCLLVTQRTANVTKTILNQCNTIFAMRTFDDTGKEFLSNYIGSDYASVLPSLQARHAVFFGKASSCENPVLIRLNDRESFKEIFRQAHPPRVPPEIAAAAGVAPVAPR